ncbi:MAG: cupredoxin domain-containing protein [Candidatus Bipolaricaulia bacterium]
MRLSLGFMVLGMLVLVGVVGCNPTEPLPPGAAREFVLVMNDMRFIGESPLAIAGADNPDIVVQVGDRVKITLKNKESQLILHDFKISNYDAHLSQYLRPNQSATVEFVASKAGEFTYYDPLNPTTMRGRFIVLGR